ncbi:Sodium/hydrogen exchanger family-domain-containing protein [Apiosordaria backusii]|uniref:Sodium/hydrogen exchanger family-domain-containing protein n=1 Tax=Apiosordaria backusii TaxID=314023 RepID=A0AA39ZY37_9PEZI|nr:Sodium/hydrogen exchanger family-domain-containing protein [Apiosordaria backusii]
MATTTATPTGTAATATPTAVRAPAQAGLFEGLNPSVYNPADPLVLFIIQATIVIALTRLLYWPLAKIREPRVIAEVITGILLGPSVMGRIPGFTDAIFPPAGMAPFRLVANIGLVLFLFLVGLEINLSYLLSNWRIAFSVAALDMTIPFGLGVAMAYGLYNEFAGEPGTAPISFGIFALFIGVAMAITAFPVLCRILTSLKLLNTTVGVIVLTSGIANDVVGWVLLALCVTLVNAGAGITALWVFLVSVGYSLFLAYAVRPAFMWVLRRTKSLENGPTEGVVALTILLVLASSFFTSIIGVHSIFGAFMVGLMCPHEGGFAIKLTEKIEDLTSTLFVPLFFALSGINTNIGLLNTGTVWGYVFAIIFVAFFSKLAGGALGARMNGLVWRESFTIGTLMSCKGLVELIVLNIGLQAKILSTKTFTMFVIMALITTFATAPLVTWLYPPWYQQKLDLWKKGKIDWDGNPIIPADGQDPEEKYRKGDVANRLLVYLRTDGLSSILGLISLFTSSSASSPAASIASDTTEKAPASSAAHADEQRPLRIQGYRLVELTDRNSSVMKVSDIEDYASHDPIVKAFGTSTANNTSRDVIVSGQIAVVPEESYADTLATQASKTNSDLVLVPWSETGSISEIQSFYYGGNSSIKDNMLENKEFAGLVTDVYEKHKHLAAVGVYVDSSLLANSLSRSRTGDEPTKSGVTRQLTRDATGISLAETQDAGAAKFHSAESKGPKVVRVLYRGGEDDLFAVRLGYQLAQSDKVILEVVVEAAKDTDSEITALKTVLSDNLGDRLVYLHSRDAVESIQSLLAPPQQVHSSRSVLVVVGRSISSNLTSADENKESGSSSSSAAELSTVRKVLGPTTARLAAEVRKGAGEKTKVSLLVVQAKTAPVTTAAAGESGTPALKRKPSTYSQESDHGGE